MAQNGHKRRATRAAGDSGGHDEDLFADAPHQRNRGGSSSELEPPLAAQGLTADLENLGERQARFPPQDGLSFLRAAPIRIIEKYAWQQGKRRSTGFRGANKDPDGCLTWSGVDRQNGDCAECLKRAERSVKRIRTPDHGDRSSGSQKSLRRRDPRSERPRWCGVGETPPSIG